MIELVRDSVGDFTAYNAATGEQIGQVVKLPDGRWQVDRWDRPGRPETFVNAESARLWFLDIPLVLPTNMKRDGGGA